MIHMEEKCPLCKGRGNILKLSYIEDLIRNDNNKISRR